MQDPGSWLSMQDPGSWLLMQDPGSWLPMQDPGSLMTMQKLGRWDPFGEECWGPIWALLGPFIYLGPFGPVLGPVIHIQIMASQHIQYSDIFHDLIGGQ